MALVPHVFDRTTRRCLCPPRGVKSRKRGRQYEKVLKSIKSEGRYKGRQKEVAARIVNKTRRKKGETRRGRKGSQRKAA